MNTHRQFAAAFCLLGLLSCGGGSPTAPTPPVNPRGILDLTDVVVNGTTSCTGYVYNTVVTVRNTGNGPATITGLTLALASGGKTYATSTPADPFLTNAVPAGTSQRSRTIAAADNIPNDPYAETLTVNISYTGGTEAEPATITKTVPVPPLQATLR
jgi:hypothetical protein